VLAVDTATRSGWAVGAAVASQDEVLCFGEADTLDSEALGQIVRWAWCNAQARRLPLVLVLEAPFGGTVPMLLGLGAARERWMVAWRQAGLPNAQVVRVQPSEWRAQVLGRRWARAPRAQVRAHEQWTASGLVGERVRADEAAAILIARWASRAAKVGAVLPAARRTR
jgi:hypothetical protein